MVLFMFKMGGWGEGGGIKLKIGNTKWYYFKKYISHGLMCRIECHYYKLQQILYLEGNNEKKVMKVTAII